MHPVDNVRPEPPAQLFAKPHTFADMPKQALRELSTGPLILLAAMRSWAEITSFWSIGKAGRGSAVQTPRQGWHSALGYTKRSVVRWRGELLAHGFITDPSGQPSPQTHIWGIIENAEELRRTPGEWFRVYMRPLVDPHLSMAAKRTWIALSSFTNKNNECWPSVWTLAHRMRRDRRSARRAVSTLRNAGYIETVHSRGSQRYFLRPEGGPASPCRPATCEVTESSHSGDTIDLQGRTERPTGMNGVTAQRCTDRPPEDESSTPDHQGQRESRETTKDASASPTLARAGEVTYDLDTGLSSELYPKFRGPQPSERDLAVKALAREQGWEVLVELSEAELSEKIDKFLATHKPS